MTSDGQRPENEDTDETIGREETDAAAQPKSGFSDDAAASFIREAAEARIAELEAESATEKDRALRIAAEMENLRRRTEREIKDARTYAVANFAREMLAVMDNLGRAIAAVPAEERAAEASGLKHLIEGVEITERGLLAALERFGVKKLEPLNGRFDPNFHQAMFEVPNPAVPNNTVVQVVQDGYSIGERVLRPAMVGVSKGGPKPAQAAAEPAAAAPRPGETSEPGSAG
ncbi:nucleotide exchange factor GrpE [Aureimonas leprariae]|uniref:Protein GrpE n=1 Tax=Plantimonas leprariae TaxID=2615207 RepID=A0A7V7PP19_9HYPH|nr:nucleotide exchange factor GrpE [Aureimonas leprariae]KAB0679698.1 nucleotide exchange factor GrpE [Aureimonas leprariae]